MDWKSWILEKVADSVWDVFVKKGDEALPRKRNHDRSHLIDIIQNEENEKTILVKSPKVDFNTKSVLIVMPGEEAVFINNGQIRAVLGEGRHVLDTMNYPFLSDMLTVLSDGKRFYSSNIYFIRKAVSQPIDWGTSIQIRDPVQLIFTRVMLRGVYRIQIVDSAKFVEYFVGNGKDILRQEEFSYLLRDEILQTIKSLVSSYIMGENEEILGISRRQQFLAERIGKNIRNMFSQYGFRISAFTISGIDILNTNPNREGIEEAYRDKRIYEILADQKNRI